MGIRRWQNLCAKKRRQKRIGTTKKQQININGQSTENYNKSSARYERICCLAVTWNNWL